jgi:hypothetical protein
LGLCQAFDLRVEVEALEDVARPAGEKRLDVAA